MIFCISTSNGPIEDYYNKKKWSIANDDRPHCIPLELYRRYMKNRVLIEVTDINKYIEEHPDVKLKYLVKRDGGIGDLILLAPCLKALKESLPGIELTVACDYHNIPVVECLPYVDHAIDMKTMNTGDYDYWEDMVFYSETSHNRAREHRTDIYLEKFNHLKLDDKRPDITFESSKLDFDVPEGLPIVVVQCGASDPHRDWTYTEDFIKDIARKAFVILIDYQMKFNRMDRENVLDLRERTDVEEMINIISQADLVVSPDSGSMHISSALDIPTIGFFGIIRPDFRMRYYNNTLSHFFFKEVCDTPHCGEAHMDRCGVTGVKGRAACMEKISVKEVYDVAIKILKKVEPQSRLATSKRKKKHKKTPTLKPEYQEKIDSLQKKFNTNGAGITVVAICMNEEHNIPQFINNVIDHPLVKRTVVIDGGSTDKSVKMLRKAGAEVYVHPYLLEYHDMQAVQRNISFTYVKENERCLMMDFDECFSGALYNNLDHFVTTQDRYIEISRKTFNSYADAMNGKNQIKDYPDYQPRFFIWSHDYKWIRSPHHWIRNVPKASKVDWDILHFEKEGKNRDKIERDWAEMEKKTKLYYG